MASATLNTPSTLGTLGGPLAWAATTAGVALAAYALVSPRPCSDVASCEAVHDEIPSSWNVRAAYGLGTLLLHELVSCYITYRSAVKASQLIGSIKSWFLPSQLLSITFAVLVTQHAIFVHSDLAWYAHATAPGVRSPDNLPVYTITYVEWLINVPLLLIVAGKCALGRSLEEIARPIVVTNVYIIFAWAAFFVSSAPLRWTLVSASFAMYAWASYDMAKWVRDFLRNEPTDTPSRLLKPCLTVGLIVVFGIYGIVYLCALTGTMTPAVERLSYICMDLGSKLLMSMAFVGIRSSETVDLLITMLVQTNVPFRRQYNETLSQLSDERFAPLLSQVSQ